MKMINVSLLRLWFLLLTVVLNGCASSAKLVDAVALKYDFQRTIVTAEHHKHVAYLKGDIQSSDTVHVYLEGDGRPIVYRRVNQEPTTRKPVMLDLMSLDSAASIYLGRPCYQGLSKSKHCTEKLWTSHRYSEVVVDSMLVALRHLVHENQSIILFGYSGGGALAVLLAERLANVKAVITVAGNLDITAWVETHGYEPLSGSLNPIDRPALPGNIFQLHMAGGQDSNIEAAIIRQFVARQDNAEYWYQKDYDHICCWGDVWPSILEKLNNKMK